MIGSVSVLPEAIGCPLLYGPGVRVSRRRAGVIGTNNPSTGWRSGARHVAGDVDDDVGALERVHTDASVRHAGDHLVGDGVAGARHVEVRRDRHRGVGGPHGEVAAGARLGGRHVQHRRRRVRGTPTAATSTVIDEFGASGVDRRVSIARRGVSGTKRPAEALVAPSYTPCTSTM